MDNKECSVAAKMMAKMGWSEGKGLGKNEDGNPNIITVSKKNNTKGIGFKGNEMDWVAHQNDFDGLLSSLQDHYKVESVNENENIKCGRKTAINLELKSKHSRSRVHYHKAIKGKDLSKVNEDDLSSILGLKKNPKPIHSSKTDLQIKASDDLHLTTSTLNMTDYFSRKKTTSKLIKNHNLLKNTEINDLQNADELSQVKRFKPMDETEVDINTKKRRTKENNTSEEQIDLFFKKLNYLKIVSHHLRNVQYRNLAMKAPMFCKKLNEMYENNAFPGSNFLYIKGYGN